MTEEELDNILVHQKNRIIEMINRGDLDEARAILNVVFELWVKCDYTYKYHELQERIFRYERGYV